MGQAAQAAVAAEPGQGEFTGRQWVFLSSQMQENSLCESKPSASCWELPCGWDGPGSWGKCLPALTTKREPLLRSYQGLGETNPANVTMNIKEMPESSKGSPGPFLKLKQQGHMARTLPTLAVRANINRRISVHHCVPCWGGEREKGTKCDTKVRQINVAKWVYSPKRCLESLEHKTQNKLKENCWGILAHEDSCARQVISHAGLQCRVNMRSYSRGWESYCSP